jgi:transposase
LSLSTLADQIGAVSVAARPLCLLIEAHVLAAERLHGDDTTVPRLAKYKTDVARIWEYVRDDCPFGGPAPPAALAITREPGKANIPADISLAIPAFCRSAAMPASTTCSAMAGRTSR